MTPDQDRYLCEKYPNLYRDRNAPMNQTAMCWGFDVGSGWFDIINNLSAQLEALILGRPESERECFRASQVKSKFGGLRFYMTSSTDEMEEAIQKAESISYETCEECGLPGSDEGSIGWILTLCKKCRLERNKAKIISPKLDPKLP
jgi:hypothetical protein